jgi:flagellar basal-body rod protein FlgB
MIGGNTFSRTVDILGRAMDASLERREVIADNIANSGVPNFKRSYVNFEAELGRAIKSEKERPKLLMARSDERHFSNYNPRDYRDVKPIRVLDYLTTSKANGNNVDAEQEMMDSLENQLAYTLYAQAVNFEFSQVNLVLK